jgi:hypothetical protein
MDLISVSFVKVLQQHYFPTQHSNITHTFYYNNLSYVSILINEIKHLQLKHNPFIFNQGTLIYKK